MGIQIRKLAQRNNLRVLSIGTLMALVLVIAGCGGGPSGSDGDDITELPLPTDLVLNLRCEDVGIYPEQCVLEDGGNIFRTAGTPEFDPLNPDRETKFDLANEIPPGPTGAKARFYLWATALARRDFGENQFYTALALHELYTAAGDPLIREQALKAYKSVLDNFFNDATVFECCGEFFPFPREDVGFGFPLKELVLENIVRALDFQPLGYPGGFTPLVPDGDELEAILALPEPDRSNLLELEGLDLLTEWGYLQQCTEAGDCFLEKLEFGGGLN